MTFSLLAAASSATRAERLVAAARELADETGSSAFTVAQVSARAGLSLKAFYRSFHGKDELLIALLEDDSRMGVEIIAGRLANAPDPLRTYVDELFALASRPDAAGYAAILVREYRRLGEHHRDELQSALEPLTTLLASHLATADPKRDAETMFGVLMNGINDIVLGRVDDVAEHAGYLHQFCTRGLESL
jgi:AcrR family transcriptional regulator